MTDLKEKVLQRVVSRRGMKVSELLVDEGILSIVPSSQVYVKVLEVVKELVKEKSLYVLMQSKEDTEYSLFVFPVTEGFVPYVR